MSWPNKSSDVEDERAKSPSKACKNKKVKYWFGEFETELIWSNIIIIGIFYILYFYAVLTFPYIQKWYLFAYGYLYAMVAGYGGTSSAHRYYSHRSYKATKALQIFNLMCYSTAGLNPMLDWVRDHRIHHKFSETDADPHNAKRGFFFAHVGWLMMKKHPNVIAQGKLVDCSDIIEDPLIKIHTKYFKYFSLAFCFVIPILIPVVCWNETWYDSCLMCIIRYWFVLNIIWSVNSAAHMFGNKPYDKSINPSQSIWVSFFASGEGWHNYHHTFPWDYRAAEAGQYFNLTTNILDMFAAFGLAYDLKVASPNLVQRVIQKSGDGSHHNHTSASANCN